MGDLITDQHSYGRYVVRKRCYKVFINPCVCINTGFQITLKYFFIHVVVYNLLLFFTGACSDINTSKIKKLRQCTFGKPGNCQKVYAGGQRAGVYAGISRLVQNSQRTVFQTEMRKKRIGSYPQVKHWRICDSSFIHGIIHSIHMVSALDK